MTLCVTKYRQEQGISMAELSRRSGVSVSTISDIESGGTEPTLTTLHRLAKALNVSIHDLFTCED